MFLLCVSGSDSPTSPVKDLTTHTRAMRLKHQALEERLELCLLELRKLCIREAVSKHTHSHSISHTPVHTHTLKTGLCYHIVYSDGKKNLPEQAL